MSDESTNFDDGSDKAIAIIEPQQADEIVEAEFEVVPDGETAGGSKKRGVSGESEGETDPTYDRLRELQIRHDKIETEILFLSAQLKDTKKELEVVVEKIVKTIREMGQQNEPNLFNQGEASDEEAVEIDIEISTESESWRSADLKLLIELGMPKKAYEAMGKAGLHTMGDLSKWLEPNPNTGWQRKLTDLDGIGEKMAEKIEAAMDRFWKERPDVR